MLEKFKNTMIYGGLQKSDYQYIQEDVTKINNINLKGISIVTAAYMVVMLAVSLQNSITSVNRIHFIWCLCICSGILVISMMGILKTKAATMIALYVYLSTIFCYGIAIGVAQTSQTAVSFLIFIMVGPLLFFDRPIKMNCFIWIFNILFIIAAMKLKTPLARNTDLINALSYGVISCFINTGAMVLKMRFIWLQRKMRVLAETDILTSLKNRNSFEHNYESYMIRVKKSITCIYIDANGLHALNNSLGHKAGDKMLKYLAEQITIIFGREDSYRVGGDEFLIVRCDEDVSLVNKKVEELSKRMACKNYSISAGVISAPAESLNLDELVKRADAAMYQMKKRYYAQKDFDRRQEQKE